MSKGQPSDMVMAVVAPLRGRRWNRLAGEKRASLSVALNIAEGSGRTSVKDRRRFFIMARSSIFESAAILDILKHDGLIVESKFKELYRQSEELSKMLRKMIKKFENRLEKPR